MTGKALLEADWERVARLMLKSFTGGGLTDSEQEFLQLAFELDRERYGKLSRSVRLKEIQDRQKMFQ